MNLSRHILPIIGCGFAAAAILATVVGLTADAIRTAPLRWDAVDIAHDPVRDGQLVVRARQDRRDTSGCTNNIQADMRAAGVLTRLDAPVRTLAEDGRARYVVALPRDLLPGRYDVRLREVFNCGGRPIMVEAPWLTFTKVQP